LGEGGQWERRREYGEGAAWVVVSMGEGGPWVRRREYGVMREVRGKWREGNQGMERNKFKEEVRSAYEGEGTLKK
jgi:hypothetical protein